MLLNSTWSSSRKLKGSVLITPESPTFLAPGTDFVEDTFSVDHGVVGKQVGRDGLGMIQALYIIVHFISDLLPLLI